MVDVNRYRPFVGGPRPKNAPPGQPDPPTSEEGQLLRNKMASERDELGGPMEVPEPPPGVDDPDSKAYREGRNSEAGEADGETHDTETDQAEEGDAEEEPDWEQRARAAYRTSTDFTDTNFRRQLEDSLRAFNNQHPSDSKYNSETFRKRSNLYRPKIRTIIRKNEAALCAALFSNLDLIETEPFNTSDIEEIVSAEVMKALLQYRLTTTMPWFQFAMGAMQDAQTQGIVIAHSFWSYKANSARGEYAVKEDRPAQELIPAENFRFDPSAKWFDVVNTSPYLIELIPMYIGEVKERMQLPDPKGRKWHFIPEETIASCWANDDESTRMARTGNQQDQTQQPRDVTDYDVVWVHRHIHRWQGEDYEFYMLASKYMLTDPEPMENNVWFGERPYVVGTCILETHKPMPTSLATLLRPLADEANDLQNQGSDNMKFILNKAWFVKRSANVDTTSLVRNVPGRVTMVNDPEKDVKEVNWPDLPQSLYEEKNRNDADFDQLGGNFNPMQLAQTRSPRESFRTLNAVQSPAMMVTEYTLMTLVQTFLLPALRQLVLLEQYYETDQVLLKIAGEKAKVLQRFGVSELTDAVLEKRMSVNVNLGMGATDPTTKQQRFSGALTTYAGVTKAPPPGLDLKEVGKELFALAGYRDAMRFFIDQDPEKVKMQQTIQALTKKLQVLDIDKRNKHDANVVKLVSSRESNLTKLALASKEDDHQSRHLLIGHLLEMEKVDKQSENQRAMQAEGAMQGQASQAQGAAQQQALQAAKPQPQAPKAA
jgi:hypothetical protein